MLKLIESEREGEQIDRSLLKNVLAIFQEVRGWVGQPYVTGGFLDRGWHWWWWWVTRVARDWQRVRAAH